ncbi:MAG: XRE family transcriptional regulator [uncultured bacterium]|nr:MAG: XRE family transcriptional regulator [uncultured bacterium]
MTTGFTRKKINNEKTVGEKLRLARKRMNLNLESVERETKVSLKYLQLIENGSYNQLPADIYVVGFLRRWADFLQLDSKELIRLYREEKRIANSVNSKIISNKSNILKPNSNNELLKIPGFVITPKLILSTMVIIAVMGILSYIWYQVKGFAAAPPLELANSGIEQVVKVETITITGQTDPGAELQINNQAVSVDQNGVFTQLIKLNNGVNNIEITAKNKANKETRKIIKLLAEY